jgi:hypothetical protein
MIFKKSIPIKRERILKNRNLENEKLNKSNKNLG